MHGLPRTTEYVRLAIARAALDGPAWDEAMLVELADTLPFLRAVILDCEIVGRFEHAGLAALHSLLETLTLHRCRVLLMPPTRAGFRAIWVSSGTNLRFPEPTPAQLARAVDLPGDEDERLSAGVA
jgi:hypothetical protein